MIGPLVKLAGRKEVFEAVAIAGLTALVTKGIELLYDRISKSLKDDDKKKPRKRAKKPKPEAQP